MARSTPPSRTSDRHLETLRPAPEAAWWDRPDNYDDDATPTSSTPALHTCVVGAPDGDTEIVLFGDSHALQWLPALTADAGPPAGASPR